MCGIAGAARPRGRPVADAVLRRMSDVIAHRGPDGEGHYVDGPVGLVTAGWRSSICRPRATADDDATASYVITYNGEIYNFRELRAELERAGPPLPHRHRHRGRAARLRRSGAPRASSASTACSPSRSGTAAARAVPRSRPLRGQAAVLRRGRADAAVRLRDQVAARRTRRSQRGSSPRHLLEYFTFQNFFTDGTLFAGVKLLPAGPLARCRPDARRSRSERYWDFDFAEPGSEPTTASTSRSSTASSARPSAPARQPTSRSAPTCPAAWTRARSPRSPRQLPHLNDLHGRLRPDARASGMELGFDERRRPRRCPTCSRPNTTRRC